MPTYMLGDAQPPQALLPPALLLNVPPSSRFYVF